jgi:hypothetical protein
VYLTEEEWEKATLESLAECISTKRENPGMSEADWNREQRERQKGFRMTVVLVNVILEPMAGSRDRCAAPTQFGQQLVDCPRDSGGVVHGLIQENLKNRSYGGRRQYFLP